MKRITLSLLLVFAAIVAANAQPSCSRSQSCDRPSWVCCHPWQGMRIGFLGDSMTDPKNNKADVPRKYWSYLQEWLRLTPYVYGISGRQWNDIPRQAERLYAEHGDSVDALIVLIGTNDFNAGVPVGKWYDEAEGTVTAAVHGQKRDYTRLHRTPSLDPQTLRGRINAGVMRMKELFPDKPIVLLTPIHRAYAEFGATNIQPDESWQNACGEYFDAYVGAIKEAANVWGIPVVDLNSLSGMNPMVAPQQSFYRNSVTDLLHPGDKGQRRIARAVMSALTGISPE